MSEPRLGLQEAMEGLEIRGESAHFPPADKTAPRASCSHHLSDLNYTNPAPPDEAAARADNINAEGSAKHGVPRDVLRRADRLGRCAGIGDVIGLFGRCRLRRIRGRCGHDEGAQAAVRSRKLQTPSTGFRCCSTCAPGLSECGGACVNFSSNSSHCGACGTVCAGGTTCQNGRCR